MQIDKLKQFLFQFILVRSFIFNLLQTTLTQFVSAAINQQRSNLSLMKVDIFQGQQVNIIFYNRWDKSTVLLRFPKINTVEDVFSTKVHKLYLNLSPYKRHLTHSFVHSSLVSIVFGSNWIKFAIVRVNYAILFSKRFTGVESGCRKRNY